MCPSDRGNPNANKMLAAMEPSESLWQAGAGERGVTSATFYNRLRKYMVASGLALLPVSTSSATRPPSCAVTQVSRSRR
jgi:hypothetical protein